MVTTVVTARPRPLSSITLSVRRNFLLRVTKKLRGRFSRLTWMRRQDGPIETPRRPSTIAADSVVVECDIGSCVNCCVVGPVDADDGAIGFPSSPFLFPFL